MSEAQYGAMRGEPFLTIESREDGEAIIVALKGEFDLASAQIVEEELATAQTSFAVVILDLRGVTFMDSTGLHAVLNADRRMRGSGTALRIVPGSPQVQRLLELTGADKHLETTSCPVP